MAKKADVVELGAKDGVSVEREGKVYVVATVFSGVMQKMLNSIPGIEKVENMFGEGKHGSRIPAEQGDKLAAAVADMRDFQRNNGVLVKDVGGDKHVFFDYEKLLTQEIGKVDKANFDKEVGAWVVKADSAALKLEGGKQVPYLDMVVNRMRGIVVDIQQEREEIKAVAAELAASKNLKPGIEFANPKGERSFSGPIVSVKSHFALQETGEKDGVAFMAIHALSALEKEKPLFLGENMRIDYNNGHTKVRTVAEFEKQKVDRESIKAVAAKLVDEPKVLNATTHGNAKNTYTGKVVEVNDSFVLQSAGRDKFTIHPRDMLAGMDIKRGAEVDIVYQAGKASLKERGAQAVEVGR